MKPEFRQDYTPALPARLAGSHQVSKALFTLKASTWAQIDLLRLQSNLTTSQFIEMLVLKAARGK